MHAPPRQILLQQVSTPTAACLSASRCRRTRCRPAMLLAAATAQGLTYEAAGVNIDAGSELVRRIQKMNPSIGGFSGMVPFGASVAADCDPDLSWFAKSHSRVYYGWLLSSASPRLALRLRMSGRHVSAMPTASRACRRLLTSAASHSCLCFPAIMPRFLYSFSSIVAFDNGRQASWRPAIRRGLVPGGRHGRRGHQAEAGIRDGRP